MTSPQHRIIDSHAIIGLIALLREVEELRERVREAELSARLSYKGSTKKAHRYPQCPTDGNARRVPRMSRATHSLGR